MEGMHEDSYETLLTHMEWADALTWKALLALPSGQDDTRLLDLLYRLHTVQWVLPPDLARRGNSGPGTEHPCRSGRAERLGPAVLLPVAAFAHDLAPARLTQAVNLPWSGEVTKRFGATKPTTLGETLLQVILHSTYHRGQLAARVRELGGDPPLTDFIAWVWMSRPAPEW